MDADSVGLAEVKVEVRHLVEDMKEVKADVKWLRIRAAEGGGVIGFLTRVAPWGSLVIAALALALK